MDANIDQSVLKPLHVEGLGAVLFSFSRLLAMRIDYGGHPCICFASLRLACHSHPNGLDKRLVGGGPKDSVPAILRCYVCPDQTHR